LAAEYKIMELLGILVIVASAGCFLASFIALFLIERRRRANSPNSRPYTCRGFCFDLDFCSSVPSFSDGNIA